MRMLRLGLGRVDSPDIDGRARYLAVMQHPFAGLQGVVDSVVQQHAALRTVRKPQMERGAPPTSL